VKKESKNIKILIKDDEHKIALFPKEETKDEKKDVNKEDKDNNKDCKNNNNNSMSNPFSVLINKENEPKEKDQNDNQKSLFGNIFNNNQSLFGNVNNNNANNAKSLFSIPIKLSEKEKEESYNNIIDNKDKKETKEENNSGSVSLFGNTPLFSNNGGKSLFSNNNDKSNTENFTPLLFSNMNNIKNPFADIKGDNFVKSLFSNNKTEDNKKNSEKDGALFGGDDDSEKSDENDKPKTKYVAEPLKAQDYSEYSKLFSLNLNNLFLYNKTDKKYIPKGSGFFSIEKTKDEKSEKHQAVVVFRNHAGNKLVEGFIISNLSKIKTEEKNYKNIAIVYYLSINNLGKKELNVAKIPFSNIELFQNFKKAFEDSIKYVQG
jgi:hypothetical protein